MTDIQTAGVVPGFHQGDRLRKALEHADIRPGEMAEYLGVSGHSVTRWTKGKGAPKRSILMLWAMRTGVALEWLETGKAPITGGGDGGQVYGIRDSNPEPADLEDYALTWGDAA